MANHQIKGYITSTQYGASDKPKIGFSTYKPSAKYSPETVIVAEHEFAVEVADDFDPRPAMVEALEKTKEQARAEFAKTIMQIDQRIQSLLAIANEVES